jgi:hypothetical protein
LSKIANMFIINHGNIVEHATAKKWLLPPFYMQNEPLLTVVQRLITNRGVRSITRKSLTGSPLFFVRNEPLLTAAQQDTCHITYSSGFDISPCDHYVWLLYFKLPVVD